MSSGERERRLLLDGTVGRWSGTAVDRRERRVPSILLGSARSQAWHSGTSFPGRALQLRQGQLQCFSRSRGTDSGSQRQESRRGTPTRHDDDHLGRPPLAHRDPTDGVSPALCGIAGSPPGLIVLGCQTSSAPQECAGSPSPANTCRVRQRDNRCNPARTAQGVTTPTASRLRRRTMPLGRRCDVPAGKPHPPSVPLASPSAADSTPDRRSRQ